jgi:DNA replication and repair protein RecF
MSLNLFQATGFRCLDALEIEPDPKVNLLSGPNASGKTSLLECLFYLGRGRSFRLASNRELIQTGAAGFTIFGATQDREQVSHKLGVEVSAGQRRIRVDGDSGAGADLARLLPVQVIDPEIHELVQGGPELRRRFLDWGVFHVKHGFLEAWRAYQQALRQRNAALRQNESDALVRLWDEALATQGERVHQLRTDFLHDFLPLFSSIVAENLSFDAICSYKPGWSSTNQLAGALHESLARDRAFGSTQVGPHRADLSLQVAERRARHRVSRGQQKMLAAALVIAQTRFVASHTATTPVLLVDDPAAELDRGNRERLFALLQDMPAQLFITALETEDLPWSTQARMFHVEHGKVISLL